MENKCHLMLVDDDPFLRDLLGAQLAEHGFPVITAENGMQAMELLKTSQVDAVITDIFMPDMDGIELIQGLRKHYPGMLIIALSGGTVSSNARDYLRFAKCFGADEILFKPFALEMLIAKLAQHCPRDSVKSPV